jgi:protein NUD1
MEPWLDSLSEDWKSDHHSYSPAPSISSQQKRSSIGSTKSQSRIPHLAQNIRKESSSGFLRPRSTRGLARSRNEPILTERSASSLNVPPPNNGSQKRLSVSTLPRRTSGAYSDSVNSVQHHTIHERPNDTDTPDWKRRLANGEDVASDGFDLFAPSKLEGIFKEPTIRLEKDNDNSLIDSFAKPWKSLDLSSAPSLNEQYQSLRASRSRAPVLTVLEEVDEDVLDRHNFSAISSDIVRDGSIRGIVQKRVQSLERVQQLASSDSTPAQSRPSSAGVDSTNDPRWRTVSGRKELEDEFISPVTASRQNTIRENAVKDSAVIDLETLDEKLAQIGVSHHQRPSSSSSDRQVSYRHNGVTAQDEDQYLDVGDITSQSLPDDLSMGTQDFMSHGGFVNRRRGGPSYEASFLKRGLSSTDHSHLGSKLKQTFRSSPPPYSSSKDVSAIDRPASPHPPRTPQEQSVVHHVTPGRPTSSGSPLKLFGNRDTYTNNKLMRILSHFDGSEHSNEGKLDDAPPTLEQYELRMSRFGEGELNNYDFDFERQVSPVVAHLLQDAPSKIFVKQADATPDEASKQPVVLPGPLRSPKRRRTLLKGEIRVDDQHLEVKVAQVEESSKLAGTKRKDARPGDAGSQAEPDVLASRALLNPRSSRRSSIPVPSRHSVAPAAVNHADDHGKDVTEALAAELASFAHEAAEMHNDSRKPSLATKDYMEEANKVMEFIRARGKPKSALPDIEEPVEFSELDADKILDMDLDDESTKDHFSRPPSREGVVRPSPDRRHAVHDPRTASYLRKYQEDDDLELLANTSGLGALRVADNKAAEEASHVPVPVDSDQEEQESSPPNVRILNADQSQRKRKHSGSTVEEQNIASLPNNIATHSSDNSTRRTFPTSSSSGNRGMITHGTVSIPDQVGTMTFDHQRKIWVQATASLRRSQVQNNKERHSNTEDDPFASIPDLSFEELPAAKSRQASHQVSPEEDLVQRNTAPGSQEALPRSPTKPAAKAPTRTRDMNADHSIQQQHEQHGFTDSSLRSVISQHEARLHDGIASKAPSAVPENKRQVRAVTIAFSSPLVSAVKYPEEPYLSDDDLLDEDVNLPLDDSEESLLQCSQRDARSLPPTPQQTPSKEEDRRYQNYRAMTLNRRPVSRIDEKEEDEPHVEMSLVHVKHSQQLTPAPLERSIVKAKAGKGHNTSILCLTPLSEFSLHQIDLLKHPEESFVEERANPKALRQANGSQALSVDAVVKAITDAADGEIYWEKLRTLKLDDKRLTSLHSLKDYCFGLEELSVVRNNVQHLNGLPASLRVLDIQQNGLTSLASWGALRNLQYLDLSGNQLESLDGFSCLVHLRKLIANDNQIKNIDGVMELNGLLELEVRGNSLIDVDFEGCEMLRLKKLDLGSNKLRSVRNLHKLTSLEELTVSRNQLSMFGGQTDARSSQSARVFRPCQLPVHETPGPRRQ